MKRAFDLTVALTLLGLLAPLIALIALSVLLIDGRPVLFICERMKTPDQPFALIKFRTMRVPRMGADMSGVSGGDKTTRITRLGAVLRRLHFDELPQLINILRVDMGLVGPRPPLRQYTDQFPDLYRPILRCRPGITGLATLVFHRHENRLIAKAQTAHETDAIYVRRCIPRKARLDLLYASRASLSLDLAILIATVKAVFLWRGTGVRRPSALITRTKPPPTRTVIGRTNAPPTL